MLFCGTQVADPHRRYCIPWVPALLSDGESHSVRTVTLHHQPASLSLFLWVSDRDILFLFGRVVGESGVYGGSFGS